MIAICSVVKDPLNFDWWLDYHFGLGIDYIFLKIEDTLSLQKVVEKYPNVVATYENKIDRKNNYLTLIDRQRIFFNEIKSTLIDLEINWLFHIDSDELILCNGNLKEILDEIPDHYQTVRFTNYEAVYDSDDLENPFIQSSRFRYGHSRISYKNGKSAGRVNNDLGFKSPHKFHGNRLYFPETKIVILHYESATFESWYSKFNQEFDEDKITEIPFEFYKKSIEVIKNESKETAREYYNQMKVNVSNGIIKLYWTPNLEQKNISWSK